MIPAPYIRKDQPGRYVVFVGAEGLVFKAERDAQRFVNAVIRACSCTWIENEVSA